MSTRLPCVRVPFSLVLAAALGAQDPAPTPSRAALPEAGSDAANAMLLRACSTMTAATSGSFTTDTETDVAMMRGHGLPIGEQKAHLEGGWDQQQRWGRTDDDTFVIRGGRMVAETERGWALRSAQLPSGAAVPFVLQPRLLFAQLAELPARARKVVHVEEGKVGDRDVAILTLRLTGDDAEDLALGGALPSGSGGSGMLVIGGLLGGGQRPQKHYSVDLAVFTAVDNGHVLRLRAKVYEDDPIMQNVQIRFGGAGAAGGGEDDDEEEKAVEEKTTDPEKAPIKKGLPEREPTRTETVHYLRADFSDLGKAKAPAVDANGLRWLTEN